MQVSVRQMIGGVVVLLVGLAGLLTLFTGPIPATIAETVGTLIPPLPASTVQLIVAGTLVALGVFYFWDGRETPDRWTPLIGETPPERPQNAPKTVGETLDTDIVAARQDIRLKEVEYDSTEPHRQLRAIGHRAVKLAWECTDDEAARAIDGGTWTDDPIVAAFLGNTVDYPFRYQLFIWTCPEAAYERAVERTGYAIDRFVHEEVPGTKAMTMIRTADSHASEPNKSWFERVRKDTADTDTNIKDLEYKDEHGDKDEPDQGIDDSGDEHIERERIDSIEFEPVSATEGSVQPQRDGTEDIDMRQPTAMPAQGPATNTDADTRGEE